MGLSQTFVDGHIAKWEAQLQSPYYPYRRYWPSRLFHHSPLENAVKIILDGNLRSRSDPKNSRNKDVAAGGVIDNRNYAHSFVRLYFRPRTPTQYHIEGIRKDGEFKYGENAHAPVLIMFVLDARRILVRNGVEFCDRNMQLGSACPSDTMDYFENIPFNKVYHEGNMGGDIFISQHRCAEVLVQSPLPLRECVQWIYCRSKAERETLLHFLGRSASRWDRLVKVSEDLKVFQRQYVFVEEVSISNDGISFRLNPRLDRQNVEISIEILNAKGVSVHHFRHSGMPAVPDLPAVKWITKHPFSNGRYHARITLEGQLAFETEMHLGPVLF